MDFKRIEIIFIVTFLFLNGFFLYQLSQNNQNSFIGNQSGKVDLVTEMENQGITLPAFDDEELKVPYVQAEANNLLDQKKNQLTKQTGVVDEEGMLYVSILSEPVKLSEDERLTTSDIQRINTFIKSKQVLFGEEYEFIRYVPNKKQIIYGQIANHVPIADGTANITLHLNGSKEIISYEQTYAGPVTVQGDSRQLITDKNAVEVLYQNNKIPADADVRKPILTYYRTLNLNELSMYAPVWTVEIISGSNIHIEQVDAVSGSVLQESMSDDKEETQDVPADSSASTEDSSPSSGSESQQ